jgi:hypothetical protein
VGGVAIKRMIAREGSFVAEMAQRELVLRPVQQCAAWPGDDIQAIELFILIENP